MAAQEELPVMHQQPEQQQQAAVVETPQEPSQETEQPVR
jgi:hypothetical protein